MFYIPDIILKIVYIFILLFINTPIMAENNVYKYSFNDIDGKEINLEDFKGKPIFLVNTASKCGFTPQYGDLQTLFQEYKSTDLIFIATPSNQFKQELSSEEEIKKYCLISYGVSFNVTEIVEIKGTDAHPLYKWLGEKYKEVPKWNFYKYLFDRDGKLIESWSSMTKPTSNKIKKSIKKVL
tara:strand:+ start:41 stop:586 length:546 start_codon:yes stop_codon:yes gene_type:complete